jgi:hypothetical protein
MSSLRSVFGPRARLVWRLALILALAALAALAVSGAIDPLQSGVLTMLPAVALAVMMLTRPYLGERVIARLRARRPRRPSAVRSIVGSPRREVHVARGGRLIAVALAGRAPPLVLAGCR